MRFTIAEFIVTQTHVELDKPNAYHAYGIPFFFKYTRTSISDVEQTTPLRNMDRTAYLTFEDRSVVVIARCRTSNNRPTPTWKIAEARTNRDGKPQPPVDPEGPEWVWIGDQAPAAQWVREIENILAKPSRKRPEATYSKH